MSLYLKIFFGWCALCAAYDLILMGYSIATKNISGVIISIICVLICVLVVVAGCSSQVVEIKSALNYYYEVRVIDGCQYVFSDRGLAHKGNCTNSIHIYRMENQ